MSALPEEEVGALQKTGSCFRSTSTKPGVRKLRDFTRCSCGSFGLEHNRRLIATGQDAWIAVAPRFCGLQPTDRAAQLVESTGMLPGRLLGTS